MKNLRGRPRNITDAGIVYLDSDGEDSEYSDSDVEPVFFPAAEFEIGDADEFVGEAEDNEEVDNDAGMNRMFVLIDQTEDDSSDIEVNPEEAGAAAAQGLQRSVIQFFGGTVQVRHIINDNFTQLQQQQQQQQSAGVVAPGEESTSGGQAEPAVDQERRVSQGLDGEAPAICESEILIQSEGSGSHQNTMADQAQAECRARSGGDDGSDVSPGGDEKEIHDDVSESRREEAETFSSSGGSSGLVPYPDLPDYASAGEDDDDDNLKASIPAPYKSPVVASSSSRTSLKRKEPDSEDDRDSEETNGTDKSSRKRVENQDADEEDEETCNPMVSDEECDESEEAFRGDRIGSTVYSERHVLKILMKWIEELPQYSIESLLKARETDQPEEEIEKNIQRLNTDFEEQMSLLWDMSSETDVMKFLVENKIFSFVRDTIDRSACNRLTEIALGILANVISEPSIIEDFTIHDSSIQLVERVVELCTKVSDVSILIQVFSVLRRVVWYLRTVAPVKKWTDLLQSSSFLGCVNFIMSSSRNVLLLGNVIMLVFTLLDFLNPESDDQVEEDPEEPQENRGVDPDKSTCKQELARNYEPFCKSEFVPSICEALKELMKNPKPANSRHKLTSTRENHPVPSSSTGCPTDDNCPTADDIDIPIPEGHVQQAILKGISTLALLQKAANGQDSLRRNAQQVVPVILDFYGIFTTCMEEVTRSNSLEYFALSLHLLGFCHTSLGDIIPDAIAQPITTASKLMNQEERDKEVDMVIRVQLKDGVEFDSVTYIALVTHEYLARVAEKFGPDSTLTARSSRVHDKFFAVYDKVMARFNEETDATRSNNC